MVHNAFGLSGPALLPLFEEYMRETCSELVKPKRAWSDRQWGTSDTGLSGPGPVSYVHNYF